MIEKWRSSSFVDLVSNKESSDLICVCGSILILLCIAEFIFTFVCDLNHEVISFVF